MTADILVLPTAVWQLAHFVLFPHRDDEVDFEETFSQCQDMFENLACVYTHAVLRRRVLLRLLGKDRTATIAYLHQLKKRWTAFNSGGRSLFPWELAINGAIYRRRADNRGFVEPPNYQISILHPTVALEYQDTGSGDFNDAIVLELLGWYRWRWGGDDGSTMKKPFDASLITSWSGDNELGYGALVHLPKNWSIGVTRRSIAGNDETTILLSVDLGKFLVKEEKLRQNLIEKLLQ